MNSTCDQDGSLQRRSLAAYLWLMQIRPMWAGRLVMLSASRDAAAVAMAILAAGGTVLWMCPDEAALRTSGLDGLSDFQVTTLSEALRILKNEIRKALPVSVAVLDAAGSAWHEAVVRGVQPNAILPSDRDEVAARPLADRGALRLCLSEITSEHKGSTEFVATNWRERRDGDADILAGLDGLSDAERSSAERWLRAAPRLFPRDRVRCIETAWLASKGNI